jgi:hypothetical protein
MIVGFIWLELLSLTGRKHQKISIDKHLSLNTNTKYQNNIYNYASLFWQNPPISGSTVLGTTTIVGNKYGRQSHQNWMPLPVPRTVYKKLRLPFGLVQGGGSVAEEQP